VVRRFARRLSALARRRLHPAVRPRVDPEDVVQSVFRCFFDRQARSPFALAGWDDLWRLLACITVRKCARKAVRACRETLDAAALASSIDPHPTPEEAVDLTDTIEYVLRDLCDREREMLLFRLRGWSSSEVADRFGCTERKVQRLVEHVRGRIHRLQTCPA
jgi:RNA polymerase sigma-70 factor (ECF subfamily)